MKKLFITTFLAVVSAAVAEKPNVVFILADDLGLGDVSYHARRILNKEPFVETPNIDALAEQGLWFTDGHSATALCAPTRYCVMSGNNNYRSYAPAGVWSTFAPTAFKEGEVTLGTLMRDAGYRTGFFGKWHMGGDFQVPGTQQVYRGPKSGDIIDQVDVTRWIGGGPKYCGFDYDFTTPCGVQGPMYLFYENQQWAPLAKDSKIVFFNKDNATNPKDVSDKGPGPGDSNWDARKVGKLLSAKAVDFIKANAQKKEPFFLYYCSPTVHLPHCPPDEFDGRKIKGSSVSDHLDMTADLDMQVKRIVDALKASGEFENTLIVFSSDNGGLTDGKAKQEIGYEPGGGWNGSKNLPLEGGHRVPTFAVWPGHIQPGVTGELAVNQDMVATFAALVGTTIPKGQAQDSNNLLPLLTGKGRFVQRDFFVNQAGANQELMYRKMPWKLIIQSNFKRTQYEPKALYNLKDDPGEKKDLIKNPEYKKLVETMFKEYMDILQSGQPTAPGR
ncbi:Arylsulfatase [Pontiella desulfatans]|uniref:Arylsulfatase n=1 Tax=Pontiella desulfatans TaxID=2750659 RepID=A0A6C2TWJ9_PONDE|nr:arylsulfatase [Pontiella desulfatans]SPS73627.1 sulfatase S1_15 [Kiritimatiellales bacterium]VGO11912.1 Arylsulfatase [Pontiella desulfatans]